MGSNGQKNLAFFNMLFIRADFCRPLRCVNSVNHFFEFLAGCVAFNCFEIFTYITLSLFKTTISFFKVVIDQVVNI